MSTKYATGRSRTIRLRVTITVSGVYGIPGISGGSDGGGLGAGSDYTSVSTSKTLWQSYAEGFQCLLAVGSRLLTSDPFGPRNIALGIQVPSIGSNGFIPLVLASVGASVSGTVVIDRVVRLTEYLDHTLNGRRTETLGASGTCYETYSCSGSVFTKFNGGLGFPPGGNLGYGVVGTSTPGYGFNGGASATTRTTSAYSGGDIESTWSVEYIDADGNPVFGTPDIVAIAGAAGSVSYGKVRASGAALNAGSETRHSASASFGYLPRHAFAVEMAPLALPDARSLTMLHRLQVDWVDPFGGGVPATGTDYTSSGETVTIPCGGTKGTCGLVSTVSGESSTTRTFNSFLPLVQRLQVTDGSSQPHWFTHVRSPFSVLGLSQASGVSVPGAAGLAVPVGVQDLTVALAIGYRYLRVTAKTPSGTGSLAIKSYLNGDAVNHTSAKTLTTITAGVSVSVELDLLEVVGCTTLPDLVLDKIHFVASGADFTIDSIEVFRRSESLVQSLGNRRALFPLAMPSVTSWLECYTDGVRSKKQAISGNGTTGVITVPSLTVRQLVAELNATTRHSYGSWFTGMDAILGTAVTSISPLLGWVATDTAVPSGSKSYGADETYNISAWSDSDVPVSMLHGDGVIGSSLLLTGGATSGITLQAQRLGQTIEPGVLPGSCGFDGTDGAAFGESAADIHDVTPVRFVGVFRGAAHGMEVGPLRSLPIAETEIIHPDFSTTPITPPVPVGQWVPRASGFCLSNQPLRGKRGNGFRQSTIDNAGGTAAAPVVSPYTRERGYVRVWTVGDTADWGALEHDPPRGWLHVGRGVQVFTFWRESAAGPGSPWGPLEAFHSEDLAVDAITRLERITGGVLCVLAAVGSGFKLFASGDGAKTIVEVLSMTNAASALVGYDGVRNWLVAWWEDSTTHQVKRKVSRDGGASWESPGDCQWIPTGGSSGALSGELRDAKFVRELAGRFVLTMLPQGSSTGVVLQSGDGGLSWVQVL